MLRLALAILLALPACADPSSDFGVIHSGGRLHLVSPTTQPVTLSFPDPWFQGEGTLTHATLTESTDGLRLRVAADEQGPWWVYMELDQTPAGIVVDIHHSQAGSWKIHGEYPTYAALRDATDEGSAMARNILARCGLAIVDLDPPPAPPPSIQTLAIAETVLRDLDADAWIAREAASRRLRDSPELLAAVRAVAANRKVSCEVRQRIEAVP